MGSSSSRHASDSKTFKFDVFLSFRGRDTRKTFTDHLFSALNRNGIITFRDDEKLRIGETISDQILKAIEDSRSSIVILSQNYASSPCCLDELVKILKCKKAKGQIVLPVFYNVEPSDVRQQLGSFKDTFEKFKERKTDPAKVKKWKKALTEVANLSGRRLGNEHEARFIERIVDDLFTILGHRFSGIPSERGKARDIKLNWTKTVGIAVGSSPSQVGRQPMILADEETSLQEDSPTSQKDKAKGIAVKVLSFGVTVKKVIK